MTIADDYLARTGESITQACVRLHAAGWGIQRTAKRLGYGNASDLRRYLRQRGIECPWPKDPSYARGGTPQIKITMETINKYNALRKLGLSAQSAAVELGYSIRGIRDAEARLGATHLRIRDRITQQVIDQFQLLLAIGLSANAAAAEVGYSPQGIKDAMHRLSNNQSATPKNISAVYKTSVQSEPSRTRCQ